MNKLTSILLIVLTAGMFSSCSTDFDVTAPYKEVPVVYGLINKDDSVHYFRINKAYLPENQSALIAAQEPDSIYLPGNLLVELNQYNGATLVNTYILRMVDVPKSDGIFGGPNNHLYRTPPGIVINQAHIYELVVKRAGDNSVITRAKAPIVNKFNYSGNSSFEIAIKNNAGYATARFKWTAAKNGRMYNMFMRFNYYEIDKATHDTTYKHVDFQLLQGRKTNNLLGTEFIEAQFGGQDFYNTLKRSISVNDNVIRKGDNQLEFYYTIAGDELARYMDLNSVSTINDISPEYSNIENGYGIMSSRLDTVFRWRLSLDSYNELNNGPITGDLFN
jgi:hypothetical protein